MSSIAFTDIARSDTRFFKEEFMNVSQKIGVMLLGAVFCLTLAVSTGYAQRGRNSYGDNGRNAGWYKHDRGWTGRYSTYRTYPRYSTYSYYPRTVRYYPSRTYTGYSVYTPYRTAGYNPYYGYYPRYRTYRTYPRRSGLSVTFRIGRRY